MYISSGESNYSDIREGLDYDDRIRKRKRKARTINSLDRRYGNITGSKVKLSYILSLTRYPPERGESSTR